MQGRCVVKRAVPVLVAIALAIAVSFGLAARADAASSEQIVFSGIGFSPSANAPFGFWIWCESAESSNPYAGECNGAMYFYTLGITKHVEDTVPLQEPSEGQYLMTVQSRDGSISCTLENDPPATSGPTNTVHVSCGSPLSFTDGLSTNAVVNVTGP
jgi:hypothetical protein